MNKKFFTNKRIMLLCSFILLTIASILSFLLPAETRTIIPYPAIVIPIVNTIAACISLVIFFIPSYMVPIYYVALLQSIFTTLTGYEMLGIFLYLAFILMLFCNGFFIKKAHRKLVILILIWIIILLGLIPFGWNRIALAFGSSIFIFSFTFYIYNELAHLLTPLLPPSSLELNITLPPPGSDLSLQSLGLTSRQAEIVKYYINKGVSYKYLANIFITSISTIKSEMAKVFKILGVKNKEELRVIRY